MNGMLLWGLAGIALLASVFLNFHQAQKIGVKDQALAQASADLTAAGNALKAAANNMKVRQDGNVENMGRAEQECLAAAQRAYDAGSLRGDQTVAQRAASGAFVPRQRVNPSHR